MIPAFKIGDSVLLLGSEPVISIFSIVNPDNRGGVSYICKWIDNNKQPHEQVYKEEMVKLRYP